MKHDERAHLFRLLGEFRVGMLTTHASDGELRGRPMLVANVEDDGEIVFCSHLDSAKIEELISDPRCAVLLQGRMRWVSLTGHARIDRDRERIRSLWRPIWRLWFSGGRDDPQLTLVVVRPVHAEYWDESGIRPLRFAARAVRRLLQRTPMAPVERQQHSKLVFGSAPG